MALAVITELQHRLESGWELNFKTTGNFEYVRKY
jgi:hypothetical protein